MKTSQILACISRILFPFILLFGIYVIVNGHMSPGGGFQGGAILATAILITYFIDFDKIINLNSLIKLEKYVFTLILVTASISVITKGEIFTSFLPVNTEVSFKPIFLVILNSLIGIKVAIGLITLFSIFIKEGK